MGLIVGRFDRKGLHQLRTFLVADEDLRGGNALLLTFVIAMRTGHNTS